MKALGTLQMAMSQPSCTSIMVVKRTDLRNAVGDVCIFLGNVSTLLVPTCHHPSFNGSVMLELEEQMGLNNSLHLLLAEGGWVNWFECILIVELTQLFDNCFLLMFFLFREPPLQGQLGKNMTQDAWVNIGDVTIGN